MGLALVLALAWRIDSLEEKIRHLSLRDDLTGLYNRRGFFLFAEREYRLANRSEVPFSVLFIDLDGLKRVNDRLGHEVGSTFLRETANLMKKTFRDSDILARIGGDEFVVAGTLGASGVTRAAQRLEEAAADRNASGDNVYPLGFSIGYAISDSQQPETLEELLNRADSEMYRRKRDKGTGR
jgi:diguanylate cyclase (GGDEF)-like protein